MLGGLIRGVECHETSAGNALVGLTMLVGTIALLRRRGGRVHCRVPTAYRVVCYNDTPYRVRVRLNVFTTAGLRIRWF